MTNLERAVADYVDARKAHTGQAAAYERVRRELHASMRERFPRLPHIDVPPTFSGRLRAAWRALIGQVA